MNFYRIKGWSQFQHYKDRAPPWIKLHKTLITSRTWVNSDDASRSLAIACMLIAADTDNQIPADPAYIKRVAYLNCEPDFGKLVDVDFIELIDENGKPLSTASNVLAICTTEKRREETDSASAKRQRGLSQVPEDWNPKATTVENLSREFGLVPEDVTRYVAAFHDACKAKGYRYKDFDAAFRNCVRQDWPKLRVGKPKSSEPRFVAP